MSFCVWVSLGVALLATAATCSPQKDAAYSQRGKRDVDLELISNVDTTFLDKVLSGPDNEEPLVPVLYKDTPPKKLSGFLEPGNELPPVPVLYKDTPPKKLSGFLEPGNELPPVPVLYKDTPPKKLSGFLEPGNELPPVPVLYKDTPLKKLSGFLEPGNELPPVPVLYKDTPPKKLSGFLEPGNELPPVPVLYKDTPSKKVSGFLEPGNDPPPKPVLYEDISFLTIPNELLDIPNEHPEPAQYDEKQLSSFSLPDNAEIVPAFKRAKPLMLFNEDKKLSGFLEPDNELPPPEPYYPFTGSKKPVVEPMDPPLPVLYKGLPLNSNMVRRMAAEVQKLRRSSKGHARKAPPKALRPVE